MAKCCLTVNSLYIYTYIDYKQTLFKTVYTYRTLMQITNKQTCQMNLSHIEIHIITTFAVNCPQYLLSPVVVAFSSLARIWGECSTTHSPPALFFPFFLVEISLRALIPLSTPGQSTLAQRAEMTVAECSLINCV